MTKTSYLEALPKSISRFGNFWVPLFFWWLVACFFRFVVLSKFSLLMFRVPLDELSKNVFGACLRCGVGVVGVLGWHVGAHGFFIGNVMPNIAVFMFGCMIERIRYL